MAINDRKHRELMTKYIEHIENSYKEHFPNMKFDVEKPYNFYGSRGFIDVLFTTGMTTSICEVKPVLNNLGETIRQLRKAHNAILKNAITDFKIMDLIYLRIISKFSEENVDIITGSYPILKNVNGLVIELYCEYNDEFYMITSGLMQSDFMKKYGDPLLPRWEMCKNGVPESDLDALLRAMKITSK